MKQQMYSFQGQNPINIHQNDEQDDENYYIGEGGNTQEFENFNSFNPDKLNHMNREYIDYGREYIGSRLTNSGKKGGIDNTILSMNPLQTQDESKLYNKNILMGTGFSNEQQNQMSPISSQYQYDEGIYSSNTSQQQLYYQQHQQQQQKTPQSQKRSNSKDKQLQRSNSVGRGGGRGGNNRGVNNGGLIASPYSPESIMTKNPVDSNTIHQAPGIDDSQSILYKDFDKCGRIQNTFMQRAAFAGIKNLNTASFRNDSPLHAVKSRFPEKYAGPIQITNQKNQNDQMVQNNIMRNEQQQELSTYQIISNLFPQYQQNDQQQSYQEYEEEEQENQKNNISDGMFMIEAGFQAVSEAIIQSLGSFEQWINLSVEDKLLQFASFLSNMRKDLRLGGLVGVYLLFKNNLMQIGDEIKRVIVEELFTTLSEYETQEYIYMVCALEIIGFLGPSDRSIQRIGIIKGLLCEPSLKRLQIHCFCTLIQMGFEGFQAILDLACKDYNSLQTFILQNLLQVRAIQRIILVPSILTQLNMSENTIKKQECIALLNRMGTLVWESGGLPIVLELLEEGTVDRQLLASVLRTCGEEGEDLLIKIVKYHKNYKVRMAAASVLSYRLPLNQRILQVDLRLDSNDVVQLNAIPPGQICRYQGPISSIIIEEQNKQESEIVFNEQPFVEVNSRDFLASLQRMIAMNNDYFVQQFDNDEERNALPQCFEVRHLQKVNYYNLSGSLLLQDPILLQGASQFNNSVSMYGQIGQNQERQSITENIIKTLAQQLLKEEKSQVREVIAASIGTIGLPEGDYCVDNLLKMISSPDEDPNVKAMCVWAIGRLASPQNGQKAKKILVNALKDSYWKVRAAACTAVAQIGETVAQCTIPVLTKLLREGQVNRQTVAETMINVGTLGEQTLVQILKNEPENNHKLRECIVRALALANVNNPNIDFVIEILFQTSKDKNPSVRKSSLLSLDILHKKVVNDSVTYLKARHLLPFFYRCLNDKEQQVRNCALLCIQNFGPQGELMFIEGVTKDKNSNIRSECAMGLAQIGPSTFRTLLLALHDQNPNVREYASIAIMKNMTPESIDDAFKSKDHQRQTIKCSIREVLSNNMNINNGIKGFLNRVLCILEQSTLDPYMQESLQPHQMLYQMPKQQQLYNNKENTNNQWVEFQQNKGVKNQSNLSSTKNHHSTNFSTNTQQQNFKLFKSSQAHSQTKNREIMGSIQNQPILPYKRGNNY